MSSIQICFENCETIEIDSKYIDYIFIEKVTDYFSYINITNEDRLVRSKFCGYFEMRLQGIKELKYDSFGIGEQNVLDRLLDFDDIVGIILETSDRKVDVHVPWDDNEYSNGYQETIYHEDGDYLIITIKERNT